MLGHPLLRQFGHVQVLQRTRPPVQHQFAPGMFGKGVLQHALDRRKAGASGDEDHRLVGIVADEEAAEWAFQAQDVAFLQRGKHLVGEQPPRHMANMKFQQRVVVRRIGERKAARLGVLQLEIDVLAGKKLQPLAGRQLDLHQHHVVGALLQFFHPARQRLHHDVLGGADFPGFDGEVGQRFGAAEQCASMRLFLVLQRGGRMLAVIDLAGQHLALAGPAGPVAAAVG